MKRILITGCGGPLGVNITRSLKKAPEPLYLIGTEAKAFHTHLSLTDQTHLIPPAKDLEAYLSALSNLIKTERIDMVFPTHPIEVQTLGQHLGQLPQVKVHIPPPQVLEVGNNKWLSYQSFARAGIPVPQTWLIHEAGDLKSVFEKHTQRPIWVRGAGFPGHGVGVASLPCKKLEHALAWVDYHQGFGKMLASEFLPGANLTWCGLFDQGRLVASQARERLEYIIPHVSPSGITGAPAVTRTIARQDVQEIGEAAVRALMPQAHGAFFTDMTENAEGKPCVTEVNPGRYGTTVHFYTEAGLNFPYLLVQAAFGELPEGRTWINPIAPDVYWIRTIDCGPVLVRNPLT